MATIDILNWATRTLSIFNTVAMLWLGLTVLLNAERRTWGTWVIGGGLLLGGAFFVAHSAIVGVELLAVEAEVGFWWHAAWLLFVSQPYLWYLSIAWYTGKLHSPTHRLWLMGISFAGMLALVILTLVNPLPTYNEVMRLSSPNIVSVGDFPVAVLVYPVYSILCFILAFLMLRQPATTERFMGDLARKRARPWLVGATLTLLATSLAVGSVAIWFLKGLQTGQLAILSPKTVATVMGFDLLISALVAVTVVLVGKAIVSYEVFTGKVLPRGGLFHYWRNSLILAGSFGGVIAASLELKIDPIYRLLLATVLVTVFYALLTWRIYAERELSMLRLRPFISSQRLYERMMASADPLEIDAVTPFRALCDEILGARVAYLAAIGPLSPLVGAVLVYPTKNAGPPTFAPSTLAARFPDPQTLCIPVEPAQFGGAVWAVPLWSERGLIGVLLIGDKREGGLYSQEEIELARAVGERLIDTQASAEMAKRLMALQRQRLTEGQVIDRSARRTLHDDVLPRLHAALLTLSSVPEERSPAISSVISALSEVHHEIANLMQSMPATVTPEVANLGLVGALKQVVDLDLGRAFDGVTWRVEPEAERMARDMSSLTAEVVFFAAREAVRNAAHHARAGDISVPLHLTVSATWHNGLQVAIEDDGIGLTTASGSPAGSGRGLALHSTLMAVIGGTLAIESPTGKGTRILLSLPGETIHQNNGDGPN